MNRHRQSASEQTTIEGYRAALDVLHRCAHKLGMQASANSSLYRKVWARDSMVCLFGAAVLKDPILTRAFQQSLKTLERYQTKNGVIPNYVDAQTKQATYRAYADGGAWFVIGCAQLYRATHKKLSLKRVYRPYDACWRGMRRSHRIRRDSLPWTKRPTGKIFLAFVAKV